MKIYLFRHGETTYNRDGKFTGWYDSKLTRDGMKDARIVAKKLKDKRIDVAYQTRLSRSKDTLKEVLKYHPECTRIITDDRMIERNYGELSGRTHRAYILEQGEDSYETLLHWGKIDELEGRDRREFIKEIGEAEYDVVHRSYSIPPPGGESIEMVEERVNAFIKDLLGFMRAEKVNVAISAHSNSMRPFRAHFEGLSKHEMMSINNPWDDFFEYDVD